MRLLPAKLLRIARRSALLIALVLVGLEVTYVILVNAFLSFGGVGLLLKSTDQITVKFARAWTIVPGKLRIRDLRLTFQDHNVQWSLDLDNAQVTLDLPRLTRRTFHARSVQGDGVVFRMRHRVDPLRANEASVRALPPIPEFPSPPLFETRVASEPISDADYDLWTVHIENVDVALRELWVQQFRYVGPGRTKGSFYLRPDRWLWVGPATLTLDGAPLTAGPYTAAERLGGEIECVVHPHDVRLHESRNVFRYISSRIFLASEGASIAPSALFLPERWGLETDPEQVGRSVIDIEMEHGIFTEQSSAEFEQHDFALHNREFGARAASIGLSAHAEPGGRGVFRIEASNARFLDRKQGYTPVEMRRVDASLTSSSVDTTASWAFANLHFQADGLEAQTSKCAGSKWRSATLKLALTSGTERKGSVLRLPFSLSASKVRTRVGKSPLAFDLGFDVPRAEIDASRRQASFAGSLRIDDLDLPTKNRNIQNWWARANLDLVSVDLETPTMLMAAFHAQLRDGTPLLSVLADEDEIPEWLAKLLPLGKLEAEGMVRERCGFVELGLTRGSGGPLSFEGRLQRLDEKMDGALLVRLRLLTGISVGLGFEQGKSHVSLGAGEGWLKKNLSRLDEASRQSYAKPCPKAPEVCAN